MAGRSSPNHISTQRLRIAQLAKRDPKMVITTLAHRIDLAWMYEAYVRTRKDSAVGVDRQTAKEYEENLMENLKALLDGFKSGKYKAPPVRRVHIPKGDGKKTRPIGIPTFQDKVLQRAVAMVLEPIYETDFLECSYGFRPGRSQHQALKALGKSLYRKGSCWVIDLDIQGYFDSIDHGHLREFLDQRVRDGVIRRMIDKWLKAGVMEDGVLTRSTMGSPQGGVVSPLISNIYLHEVLDEWFAEVVIPRMKGRADMVRYADDAVLIFDNPTDAERVMKTLSKRMGKYGLKLHPEKTKLLKFVRPDLMGRSSGKAKPETFDFLGFTFYWGLSRKGRWVVRQKTARDRLKRALAGISQWCRANRHRKVKEQHAKLSQKVQGHYAYYGVVGNIRMLKRYYYQVQRIWKKWLARRSQRRHLSSTAFYRKLRASPLPRPYLLHSSYR